MHYLVMLWAVIGYGNGVVWSEDGATWYLGEWYGVMTPDSGNLLHLLSHQAVHSRESTVL